MELRGKLAFAGVSLLAFSAPALAQAPAPDKAAAEGPNAEIVVTGTLIRGLAPGGSQTIGVDTAKIEAVGAPNTSDLIATIPQAGNFLTYVGVRGSSNFSLAVNRPSLRYLGFTSSSTASTLLLVDGHRLPGMGVLQNTADLDAIASGAIERVEIVPDGGSSIYGSDAVGGVMNFITRKRFDGVEVKGSYGVGDSYDQANAAVTIGKEWGSGSSAYITYDFSRHDELYGADRDWSQSRDWINNLGSDTTCTPGNLAFAGTATLWALPNLTPGLGNRCDLTEFRTFYPRETKHSALASLLIDNGGPVSFSVKAYYVHRVNTSDGGPFSANIGVPASSPFYIPVAGQSGTETFRVQFGSVTGFHAPQVTRMESYGFTPSMKADIGGDWQLNAFVNYGIGKSQFKGNLLNPAIIAPVAAAGRFDPANLGAAGNAATIAAALDWFQFGRAQNTLANARAVIDGPLFTLPGGDVRVAVGAEYIYEKYSGTTTRGITAASLAALRDNTVHRDVKAVFGEVNVPILGDENGGPFHSLSLTASGRYDDYSDFGGTFNPKIGINFEPVDWLTLRGNWGKAFQAPGLSDLAQASAQISVLQTAQTPFFDPATPRPAVGHNTFLVAVGGTIAGLQPQKAKTWSLGFDMQPPVLPGLQLGATYYNIDFKDIITIGPINLPTFYALYGDKHALYTKGDPAMATFFDTLTTSVTPAAKAAALATIGGTFANVYAVLDGRTNNQARVQTSGIDFYLRYNTATGFGSIYTDIAGTYILTLKSGGTTGSADLNGIEPNNKFKLAATLGATFGDLRAQVTWMHTAGELIPPTPQNLQQSHVDGMDVINLFFQYEVPGESLLARDLTFSINVDNVFDVDPPLYRGGTNSLFGAANGFTVGRVFKLGISKKF